MKIYSIKNQSKSLPCLYRNNSTDKPKNNDSFSHKKEQKNIISLKLNISHFCQTFGLDKVGFLTLTFKDKVSDASEAQRRFNSLRTHVLSDRYKHYIRIFERKNNRIHYHLLIALNADIRTGLDFKGVANGDYSSANKFLKSEWKFWRSTAGNFGFGRTELLPIKTTPEIVGAYLGKCISNRSSYLDKGVRIVGYSKGLKIASSRFSIVSDKSYEWRKKCQIFCDLVCSSHNMPSTEEGLIKICGKQWAYYNRDYINSLVLTAD